MSQKTWRAARVLKESNVSYCNVGHDGIKKDESTSTLRGYFAERAALTERQTKRSVLPTGRNSRWVNSGLCWPDGTARSILCRRVRNPHIAFSRCLLSHHPEDLGQGKRSKQLGHPLSGRKRRISRVLGKQSGQVQSGAKSIGRASREFWPN